MKKEVHLTLIVDTDDTNREIFLDLKTEINCCYHLFEVVDYDISDIRDDEWNYMIAKPIEEKAYGIVNDECTGGMKVHLQPDNRWNVKQLEDGRTVVERCGTSIIYPVGDFEKDFVLLS